MQRKRHLEIVRLYEQPAVSPKQTISKMYVCEGNGILFSCYGLELPWKDNTREISCIPVGVYDAVKRSASASPSRNYDHIHVLNVPQRSFILIHTGNWYNHTQGCILTGTGLKDINKDGICDVIHSRIAFNDLMSYLPDSFKIVIKYR